MRTTTDAPLTQSRRAATAAAAGILMAGPTALAFFSGGYFDRARLVAGIVAWALVLAAAVAAPSPFLPTRTAALAVGALTAFVAWSALSVMWAPLAGPAIGDVQRVLLYLGYVLAAVALFRRRWVARSLEPVLAGGALLVISYGLSERLLPDLVTLDRSVTAGGRLEQPLTYWNAMGALAAIGLVLGVRIAGDHARNRTLRGAAAAAVVPLAAGMYLTFSRGVLAAVAVGIVALPALAPTRQQLRAAAATLAPGIAAALVASALPAVRTLGGSAPTRRTEGLVLLVSLVALAALAAWLTLRRASDRADRIALPRGSRRWLIAGVAVALAGATLAAAALEARPVARTPAFGATGARLGSLNSNRYAYWRVAIESFAHRPLTGTGTAGFGAEWLRKRKTRDPTREPHSLYIGALAELGLVGLAALLAFVAAVAVAAQRLVRANWTLAAGPAAALLVYAVHAAVDWDWEMPALTLVALALAAALLAWAPAPAAESSSAARRAD
ncbi:MAG: O-antigen ligase family protein [Thermoleophilaceae bacterium]